MVSLLSHASGLVGGRADERICIGRLTVDRVFIVLPVMAYSVGLERSFQQADADGSRTQQQNTKTKTKGHTDTIGRVAACLICHSRQLLGEN